MSEDLPYFKYHPHPLKTGSIKRSDKSCICCGEKRGYIYSASTYSTENIGEEICPWCISNGKAAEKFNASFSDSHLLHFADIAKEIIDEVTKRTPGYFAWQQEVWFSHCNDACEFHGDLEEKEAKNLPENEIRKFCFENEIDELGRTFLEHYQKGGNPAIYKFVCRHCGEIKLYTDCT